MASGADDQEEKRKSQPRTRLFRSCSISNEADEHDENDAKRIDDGKKSMSPRSTLTNDLRRAEAISGRETQAHSRETVDHHDDLHIFLQLSRTTICDSEALMVASCNSNDERDIQTTTGHMRIDETVDHDDDDVDIFLEPSRTIICDTEALMVASSNSNDQRDIQTITGHMRIDEIPVMSDADQEDFLTCAIDAVLMMLLVMILTHPPLSTNLRSSFHRIFHLLLDPVFYEFYVHHNMSAIRRYWSDQITDFQYRNKDRMNFLSSDLMNIEPLKKATQLVIQVEHRCRNKCHYHRNVFQQRFSTLDLVQRYSEKFMGGTIDGTFNAHIVQSAINNWISSTQEEFEDIGNSSCEGVYIRIQQHPPFLFLDVGSLWISTDNTNVLGGRIFIEEDEYIICGMTIYNEGNPQNNFGHYYNNMYIKELGIIIRYDNGISMNFLNNERGPQTVCILMLMRISSG